MNPSTEATAIPQKIVAAWKRAESEVAFFTFANPMCAVHIPDKGHVTTRYYGWYANRPRGMRRQAKPTAADAPVPIVTAPRLAPTEASRRWAALLQQIFEVDPLACPRCAGPMRIVAFITQPAVIDQILTHLRTRATPGERRSARSPPSPSAPVARGASRASRRPTASTAPLHAP